MERRTMVKKLVLVVKNLKQLIERRVTGRSKVNREGIQFNG